MIARDLNSISDVYQCVAELADAVERGNPMAPEWARDLERALAQAIADGVFEGDFDGDYYE